MTHSKNRYQLPDGTIIDVVEPVIISASRATDIPALFGDWFMKRLADGYCEWTNPFNGQKQYVSFGKTRAIVFWTKNPEPFISKLRQLDAICPQYYFLYSLNDYDSEGYEANIPPLEARLKTFVELSNKIGRKRVLWRFDPLILSERLNQETLHKRIKHLGDILCEYTNKLIFSYVDIVKYKKIFYRLQRIHSDIREFTPDEKLQTAQFLGECLRIWKLKNPDFQISLCGQDIDLYSYSISRNSCIDAQLLLHLYPNDTLLVNYITSQKSTKDKGQRKDCGCFFSKDIGAYNTCTNGCVYCYANR